MANLCACAAPAAAVRRRQKRRNQLDAGMLELTFSVKDSLRPLEIFRRIDTDISGKTATGTRLPGQFNDLGEGFKAQR
jgi:hypothetical protein